KLLVVGGGNSAVETAVDLVAARNSNEIDFLSANEINSVTLLIRSDFTKDVKFGNKRQIYQCIDQDKVKVRRGLQVKEIRARQVVIEDLRTRVTETLENDYVFAMIGGEPPKKFLEEIGIHVP